MDDLDKLWIDLGGESVIDSRVVGSLDESTTAPN